MAAEAAAWSTVWAAADANAAAEVERDSADCEPMDTESAGVAATAAAAAAAGAKTDEHTGIATSHDRALPAAEPGGPTAPDPGSAAQPAVCSGPGAANMAHAGQGRPAAAQSAAAEPTEKGEDAVPGPATALPARPAAAPGAAAAAAAAAAHAGANGSLQRQRRQERKPAATPALQTATAAATVAGGGAGAEPLSAEPSPAASAAAAEPAGSAGGAKPGLPALAAQVRLGLGGCP